MSDNIQTMPDTRELTWTFLKVRIAGVVLLTLMAMPLAYFFYRFPQAVPFDGLFVVLASITIIDTIVLIQIGDKAQLLLSEPLEELLYAQRAKSEKELAEARALELRAKAEAYAIRNNGLIQQNISKGHSTLYVQNAQGGSTIENTRLIKLRTGAKFVQGVDMQDLDRIIQFIFSQGTLTSKQKAHSVRRLLGLQLPSGAVLDTPDKIKAALTPLVDAEIISGRTERNAGDLTVKNADEAREILGLPVGEMKEV